MKIRRLGNRFPVARKRLRSLAKRWLIRDAVDQMSPQLLEERDPAGEATNWLRELARLAAEFTPDIFH